MQVLQPEKLRSVRKAPDRELRRANHPPAESYGAPAPYPTPLATHRARQGGMARATGTLLNHTATERLDDI